MQDTTQSVSSEINFNVTNLPINTKLSVFLNDVDYTQLVCPDGGLVGDSIISDHTGNIKGKILVLSSYAIQLGGDNLIIKFKNYTTSVVLAQVTAYSSGITSINTNINKGFIRSYEALPSTNGSASVPSASTIAIQGGEAGLTPLTQTFFVDATRYPNGLVLTSAEFYFAAKDTVAPISIEIRPVDNGLPSSTVYLNGSVVNVNASDINVPTNIQNGIGNSTKFTFPQPIYLHPGEWAICLLTNVDTYYVFAAKQGLPIGNSTSISTNIVQENTQEFNLDNGATIYVPYPLTQDFVNVLLSTNPSTYTALDRTNLDNLVKADLNVVIPKSLPYTSPTTDFELYTNPADSTTSGNGNVTGALSTKAPYTGKLYKSQNTNTWLEEQNTSLTFKLNKAVFQTGLQSYSLQNANVNYFEYDNVYLQVSDGSFKNLNTVSYSLQTTDTTGNNGPLNNYAISANTPTRLLRRSKVTNKGDQTLTITMNNSSKDVAPVFDRSLSSLFTFKNLIDPYSVDLDESEKNPKNGYVRSRYISKVTTLQNGFDSTGLSINIDVNRKTGTDIGVFCRVMSSSDNGINSSIFNNEWQPMPLFNQNANVQNSLTVTGNKTYVGLSDTAFVTENYKILEGDSLATTGTANLSYQSNISGVLTTFNTFNSFQIKVVFYSNDTTIVPKIKNIIATAVI